MTSIHKPISLEYQETALPVYTEDTMFRGRVRLTQHRRGYRFSIDAVLLSHFAARYAPVETLDVGTGCGVIPLLLADLWGQSGHTPQFTAVERQPALVALTQRNIEANERQHQVNVIEADIRTWHRADATGWRLITCNPPYRPPQSGRVSPNAERAAARHELHGSLEELVRVAASQLHPEGQLAMVYPASQLERLDLALQAAQLQPVRLRYVYPRQDTAANLVLLAATPAQGSLQEEAPLYLYQSPEHRDYTPEAEAIFAGLPPPTLDTASPSSALLPSA